MSTPIARAGALAAFAFAGAAQAMSTPPLIEPAAVAGTWTLAREGGASCTLTLKAEPTPGGRTFQLELGSCAKLAGIGAARSWRVSSDGIGLVAADGSTVIFLSRHGPKLLRTAGKSSLDVGGTWTMTRD
jgi:hypothetical protein